MGSISGSIVGAIILTAAPEILRDRLGDMARAGQLPAALSPDLVRQFLFALLLIVLMLTRPQGIFGTREVSLGGLFSRRRRTLGAPPGLTR
jgi:branched-chain amino acid transport system permease protein